jgi:hypothetical protein
MPPPVRRRLARLVIKGPPRTKKTHSMVIYKGLPKGMGPGLGKFHAALLGMIRSGRRRAAETALAHVLGQGHAPGLRPLILPSKAFREWQEVAVPQLARQWLSRPPLGSPSEHLHVVAAFHLERMGEKQLGGDVAGYLQALGDVLEAARVVADDAFIRSWDGASFVRNPAEPRVEVTIYAMGHSTLDGQGALDLVE